MKSRIRDFLAGIFVAIMILLAYHAMGSYKAIWVNRKAVIQINQRLTVIEQRLSPQPALTPAGPPLKFKE